MKKVLSCIVVLSFLLTTLSAPWVEAGFWDKRRAHAQKLLDPKNQYPQVAQFSGPHNPAQILRNIQEVPAKPLAHLAPGLSRKLVQSLPDASVKQMSSLIQSLPFQYGTVRKITSPCLKIPSRDNHRPIIIHIQDVHQNPEAQENISQAMEVLIKNHRIGLVALEGAFENLNLDRFKKLNDLKALGSAADYLFQQNEMSGALRTAFKNINTIPPFVGVDDEAHYEANVQAYKESQKHLPVVYRQLSEYQEEIQKQKKQIYSPALLVFDCHNQSYHQGKLSLGEYIRILNSQNKSKMRDQIQNINLFLQALNDEQSLDFKQVERERARIVKHLVHKISKNEQQNLIDHSVAYRMGHSTHAVFYSYFQDFCKDNGVSLKDHPAMRQYMSYVLLSDKIDAETLFHEMKKLEKQVYALLAKTPEEKNLVQASKRLYLTQKLIDFALTPEEWEEYKNQTIDHRPKTIDMSSFENFYKHAQARDQAMAAHLLKKFEIQNSNNKEFRTRRVPISSAMPSWRANFATERSQFPPQSPLAILVTGGFHAKGIEKQLTQSGATVINFVPKLTKVNTSEGSQYLSLFAREKTPLQKLLAGEKLFLSLKQATPEQLMKMLMLHSAVTGAVSPSKLELFIQGAKEKGIGLRLKRGENGTRTFIAEGPQGTVSCDVTVDAHGKIRFMSEDKAAVSHDKKNREWLRVALSFIGSITIWEAVQFAGYKRVISVWWKRIVKSLRASTRHDPPFIQVKGKNFYKGEEPFYCVGVNYWSPLILARTEEGREQIMHDLDQFQKNGINVLRIMGASEGPDTEPWRMVPSLQPSPGAFDPKGLEGLQWFLNELRKRHIYAIVSLSNFWPWSGGMAQYLNWATDEEIPCPPPAEEGDWTAYQEFTTRFYFNEKARNLYRHTVQTIVTLLRGNPAVMSFELANEPRAIHQKEVLNQWIDETAELIKNLAPQHLVTTGSEGEAFASAFHGLDAETAHGSQWIDFLSVHMWPQNWGWLNPETMEENFQEIWDIASQYISGHVKIAETIEKPALLLETGYPRDQGSYDPESSVVQRQRYFDAVLNVLYLSAGSLGVLSGVFFWAWAGKRLPLKPGQVWKPGDRLTGDPPHEHQGWYSLYTSDTGILKLIRNWSSKINRTARKVFSEKKPASIVYWIFKALGKKWPVFDKLALWIGIPSTAGEIYFLLKSAMWMNSQSWGLGAFAQSDVWFVAPVLMVFLLYAFALLHVVFISMDDKQARAPPFKLALKLMIPFAVYPFVTTMSLSHPLIFISFIAGLCHLFWDGVQFIRKKKRALSENEQTGVVRESARVLLALAQMRGSGDGAASDALVRFLGSPVKAGLAKQFVETSATWDPAVFKEVLREEAAFMNLDLREFSGVSWMRSFLSLEEAQSVSDVVDKHVQALERSLVPKRLVMPGAALSADDVPGFVEAAYQVKKHNALIENRSGHHRLLIQTNDRKILQLLESQVRGILPEAVIAYHPAVLLSNGMDVDGSVLYDLMCQNGIDPADPASSVLPVIPVGFGLDTANVPDTVLGRMLIRAVRVIIGAIHFRDQFRAAEIGAESFELLKKARNAALSAA